MIISSMLKCENTDRICGLLFSILWPQQKKLKPWSLGSSESLVSGQSTFAVAGDWRVYFCLESRLSPLADAGRHDWALDGDARIQGTIGRAAMPVIG